MGCVLLQLYSGHGKGYGPPSEASIGDNLRSLSEWYVHGDIACLGIGGKSDLCN